MKNKKIIIWIVVIFTGLYLYGKFCFLNGVLEERKNRICIGVSEIQMFEQTLNTSKAICVDSSQKYINDCEAEKKKLKNNYNWLKSQQSSSTVKIK